MVLSSFPPSRIPPSIFSTFLLLTTKCSLSFEISNAAILWGKCSWEDRNGYMTWFIRLLVKPVTTLTMPAERTRSSHLSLGHPWHPQVAPIQGWRGWQGEQAWPASWCCSGSLAEQEFFLAQDGGILFTEKAGEPLGKTNTKRHNRTETHKVKLRDQKERRERKKLWFLSPFAATPISLFPSSLCPMTAKAAPVSVVGSKGCQPPPYCQPTASWSESQSVPPQQPFWSRSLTSFTLMLPGFSADLEEEHTCLLL